MKDNYIEQMVKRDLTLSGVFKRLLFVFLTLMAGSILLFTPLAYFSPLVVVVILLCDFFVLRRWSTVEFEYLYYNGEIDVDRILGKETRKRFMSTRAREMEILAPTEAPELEKYRQLKTYDCSTQTGQPTYTLVAKNRKGTLVKIVFEPSADIIDDIRFYAPNKVIVRR